MVASPNQGVQDCGLLSNEQPTSTVAHTTADSHANREKFALDWSQPLTLGNSSAKCVLTVFCIVGNLSHEAFLSIEAIRQRTELQASTIRKAIKYLLRINAITELKAKPSGVRVFRINVFWSNGIPKLQGGQNCKGGAGKSVTQNLTESNKEKKEDLNLVCFVSGQHLPENWGDLWLAYVDKRKGDGNRLTKSVATNCLAILHRLESKGRNVRLALEDAIARGWKAFDEAKLIRLRRYSLVHATKPRKNQSCKIAAARDVVTPVAEQKGEDPHLAKVRVAIARKLKGYYRTVIESAAFRYADPGLQMYVHFRYKGQASLLATKVVTPAMEEIGEQISWTRVEISSTVNKRPARHD